MARRGKAASRRDRQRRAQRSPAPRPAAPARPLPGVVSEAVEAAAEQRSVPRPAPAAPAPRPGRADPRFTVAGPSRLSERAAAEYHYVVRDLRNIGVLLAIMGVLLVAAVIGFGALGMGVR